MFSFRKKYTNETLRDRLTDALGPDYKVVFDEDGVGVKSNGDLIAYIELRAEGREAVVAFSAVCWPAFAAELALTMNNVIGTFIDVGVGFVATEMSDIREAT